MEIGREYSLISVYGVGTIKIKPNTIKIDVSLSSSSTTMHESQVAVNKSVNQLLEIFEEENICKDHIQTDSLRFYPDYDWITDKNKVQHRRIKQTVDQEISCTIYDIEKNIETAKIILDKISLIKNTERCHIIFGITDYEKTIIKARKLAYKDALEKATLYAKSAELEIIKAVKISEFEPVNSGYNTQVCEDTIESSGSTQIPISSIEIKSKIYCDFFCKSKGVE